MKQINIPLIILNLSILSLVLGVASFIFDIWSDLFIYIFLYGFPVFIIALIVDRFVNLGTRSKYFWWVLILDILLFSMFYFYYHAFDNFMSLS
ncbi:MAG: hypothetical protein QG589_156 [Patescibacteria group bacterium]|jgi:hypothetical protein|nr:hypothetical protein [Patescibacteria group bacterium]